MANRRFVGPQRGNRNFGGPISGGGVNPWQGGAAPGGGGGVPNNNIQTQLALALTSLLQPQQANDNPPSLLSLNTSPGYYNQDGYGGGGRFGHRGGGRDVRRSEPYKNRSNWRDSRGGKGPGGGRNSNNRFGRKSDNKRADDRKKEEKDKDNVEEPRNTEEESEKKRDWKNEKVEEENKTGENEENTEEGSEPKKDKSKYAGLPPSLLHCFICNKSMWDGESFQNHVGGTAHMQMLNSAEESFCIVVNILRENMRLAEAKEMIELNRMVRSNRKFAHKMKEPQSHCNMCDMKFLGKIVAHRKTAGHQRLKRFLHPKCEICNLEFPSRIEWVEHRFTPDHLHKLNEEMEKRAGGADGNTIEENVEVELEPLLEENLQSEAESPVLELDEDLVNLQNRIPAYKNNRPVGTKSLIPAQGFICELCHKFFESEELAQTHLKTEVHYHSFVTAIKKKYKRAIAEKTDDDGNWKRRKTENGEECEEGDKEGADGEGNEEGNEMYDPEEACNENEGGGNEAEQQVEAKEEQEDKWAEVDAAIESAFVEEEPEVKTQVKRAAATPNRGGRNDGPRSKRGRK